MRALLVCPRAFMAAVLSFPSWAGSGDAPHPPPALSGFVQVGLQRGPSSWESSALPSAKTEPSMEFLLARGRFFASSQRGLGFEAYKGGSLTLTGGIGYFPGRMASESYRLRGLGDVKGSTGALVTADWRALGDAFHVYSSVASTCRKGRGNMLTVGAALGFPVRGACNGWVELSGRFVDRQEASAFFGVSPLQSERSGLREYKPAGGHVEDSLTVGLAYRPLNRWTVSAYLGGTQWRGDAAASPIMDRTRFLTGGVALRRSL